MKVVSDRLEKNVVQLRVEVEPERFAQAVDQAYRRLVQRVNIPGFRRGKAPRFVFERHYGKASLVQEAVEAFLPAVYSQAVQEADLEPIDQPDVDLEKAQEGEPFVFTAKVQVKPEVKLGALSGFGIVAEAVNVTDDDVEQQLENLRQRMAQVVPDEDGEIKNGSFAVIDFEGYIDGEPFEGGKGEDYTLEIGSGTFIPGFEDGLLGARAGDEKEVPVTFPEDYQAEHLKGKSATFKVVVKEVKKKEVPALDDAFAQTVSRFQTLQELRDDISNKLRDAAANKARRDLQNKVIEAVVDAAQVEVPHVLAHREVHNMLHDLEHTLSQQGLSMERYLELTGKDYNQMHDELHEPAERRVKTNLVLGAVARAAGIAVTESDVNEEIERTVARYPQDADRVRRLMNQPDYRERIRDSLVMEKTIAHLVSLNEQSPAPEEKAGE